MSVASPQMGRQNDCMTAITTPEEVTTNTMNAAGEGESARPVEEVADALRRAEGDSERLRRELTVAIRTAHKEGMTYKDIADILGVDTATAWRYAQIKWEGSS